MEFQNDEAFDHPIHFYQLGLKDLASKHSILFDYLIEQLSQQYNLLVDLFSIEEHLQILVYQYVTKCCYNLRPSMEVGPFIAEKVNFTG